MLRKSLYSLLVLLLLVLFFSIFRTENKPSIMEKSVFKGLTEEVNVYFDDYGVPHIFADNEEDAYRLLGMFTPRIGCGRWKLIRRIAAGRLSEIFGTELLKTDKLFRGMGLEASAAKLFRKADKNIQDLSLAHGLSGWSQSIY